MKPSGDAAKVCAPCWQVRGYLPPHAHVPQGGGVRLWKRQSVRDPVTVPLLHRQGREDTWQLSAFLQHRGEGHRRAHCESDTCQGTGPPWANT